MELVPDGAMEIKVRVSAPEETEKRVHCREVTVMEKVICENKTKAPLIEDMSVPESRF